MVMNNILGIHLKECLSKVVVNNNLIVMLLGLDWMPHETIWMILLRLKLPSIFIPMKVSFKTMHQALGLGKIISLSWLQEVIILSPITIRLRLFLLVQQQRDKFSMTKIISESQPNIMGLSKLANSSMNFLQLKSCGFLMQKVIIEIFQLHLQNVYVFGNIQKMKIQAKHNLLKTNQ